MLTHPLLYQVLKEYRRPSDRLWADLSARVRVYAFGEREVWVDQGEVPRSICLLQSGAALAWHHEGPNRKLQRVWKEGELILLAESGLIGRRSPVQVVFLHSSVILELSHADLLELRAAYEEMRWYIDAFIADELQHYQMITTWIKERSAAERIADFRAAYPNIDHLLNDHEVADYLGMSLRWYTTNK